MHGNGEENTESDFLEGVQTMNKLYIIGNLTRDPELRTTTAGKSVCDFTVAVNRKTKKEGQPDADFFHVTAWNEKGEICAKYLSKGKKVCAIAKLKSRSEGHKATITEDFQVLKNLVKNFPLSKL